MLKITDDIQGLDMTFELTDKERALLASAAKQEWFDILQKLMEREIKRINVALINASGANPNEVLAKHAEAKGAGMFYVGFMQRLVELLQIEQYNALGIGTPENPEAPPYQPEFEGQA